MIIIRWDLIIISITQCRNNASSQYPNGVKYADVTPVFKKDEKSNKSNYRPISILLSLSKVYEGIMHNQIYPYLNKIFSKYQCGFRKGFSAQHCLIAMTEKCRFWRVGSYSSNWFFESLWFFFFFFNIYIYNNNLHWN